MGSSFITALKTLEEGCVNFTGLIATASTGKSSALKLVRKSLDEVEKFLEIPLEKSKAINGNF